MINNRKQIMNFLTRLKYFLLTGLIYFFINSTFARVVDGSTEKGSLIVKIIGFENNEGECWFALDSSKEVYESKDSVFIGKILPIINNEAIVTIDSLNYGNYAIRVFHDENSNQELDTNILGIPTEDYGYSNNVSSWFGPPSWEKAQFIFNKKEMTIEISVD
jgi:uncharacterized protein (DUF2141 family)